LIFSWVVNDIINKSWFVSNVLKFVTNQKEILRSYYICAVKFNIYIL